MYAFYPPATLSSISCPAERLAQSPRRMTEAADESLPLQRCSIGPIRGIPAPLAPDQPSLLRRTVDDGRCPLGEAAREQILATIERIGCGASDTFTVSDVLDELRAQGADLAEGTVRTHITSRMCRDSADHQGTTYDDLKRVGRGVYRLRQRR